MWSFGSFVKSAAASSTSTAFSSMLDFHLNMIAANNTLNFSSVANSKWFIRGSLNSSWEGHSMSTEPKRPRWTLQIFMKFSSFDLIIKVWKTCKLSFLAPTVSKIWVLKGLGNFTPGPVLKKIAFSKPY